ncbi:MAG: hypothetical protein V1766_14800 [Pseudomonadota bacterium]
MERYITITGWSKQHRQMELNPEIDHTFYERGVAETGYVVYRYNQDGTKTHLPIDPDEQITLKRCAEILADAERLTGNTYSRIDIEDDKFADDRTTISRKKYIYSKKHNRLTIWEGKRDLMPIYENYNGVITRDRDALADCLL